MPRQPKPYFRKQTKSWYFSTGGKQYPLGKDRETAFEKFYEMMQSKDDLQAEITTVYVLSQVYLNWVEKNRAGGTFDNHKRYLEDFIGHVGKRLKISKVKKSHLYDWVEDKDWSSTAKNDAMGVVLRMFNWAVEQDHITRSPIAKIKKPKRQRREICYSPKQWKIIRSHVTDQIFMDYLDFLWSTGCRPKEARDLEARHVDLANNLCLIPSGEAKGEIARVLFLTPESKEVLERLVKRHPTGPLFRNRRGNPWTKNSVKCRLTRISKKAGFRVIAYGARHSYATEGLKNGVDSVVIAQLMGHKDTSMIAKVYAHLAKNPKFLAEQAQRMKCA